jgi:predicted amidohydrolase
MTFRVALANLRFPSSPAESLVLAVDAIERAAERGARIVCFPECFVPGYRSAARSVPAPDPEFLEHAWETTATSAAKRGVAVVLGTERAGDGLPVASTLIVDATGARLGFQDKVQLDPSEQATYAAGTERRVFRSGPLIFGVVICHEGWRYPETVRWAARRGAQVVFHPQFHEAEPGRFRPTAYADPRNTFHESAVLCRAAENTCYFASTNYAGVGSPTTSAVARPDGTLLCHQPYGEEGLLIADLELEAATGLLAKRYQPLDAS